MLRYTTDRARPGLVGLYDIWPGNGADIFLQPRTRTGPVYSGEAACIERYKELPRHLARSS